MRYKVLALDLDGTLTNAKKEITPKTKFAINQVIKAGMSVVLASGRPILGIQRLADELELYKYGGYILAYNGGKIVDCKKHKIIFQETIPMIYYHDICKCAHIFGVNALTYNDTGVISESDTAQYVVQESYNNGIPLIKVESLEDAVTKPVTKFMIVGEPDRLNKVFDYMSINYKGVLNIFFSEPYFIEVMPPGVEKSTALGVLLKYLHLDKEALVACGDGLNDITMLQYSGLSIAMENAHEETKKYADYITLSNENDGVAYAINKFIING